MPPTNPAELRELADGARKGLQDFAYGPGAWMVGRLLRALSEATGLGEAPKSAQPAVNLASLLEREPVPPHTVVDGNGVTRVYINDAVIHTPENYDPRAEVRDSETGEVIFPAVKGPLRVVEREPVPEVAAGALIEAIRKWAVTDLAHDIDGHDMRSLRSRLADAASPPPPSVDRERVEKIAASYQADADENARYMLLASEQGSPDNAEFFGRKRDEDLANATALRNFLAQPTGGAGWRDISTIGEHVGLVLVSYWRDGALRQHNTLQAERVQSVPPVWTHWMPYPGMTGSGIPLPQPPQENPA